MLLRVWLSLLLVARCSYHRLNTDASSDKRRDLTVNSADRRMFASELWNVFAKNTDPHGRRPHRKRLGCVILNSVDRNPVVFAKSSFEVHFLQFGVVPLSRLSQHGRVSLALQLDPSTVPPFEIDRRRQ